MPLKKYAIILRQLGFPQSHYVQFFSFFSLIPLPNSFYLHSLFPACMYCKVALLFSIMIPWCAFAVTPVHGKRLPIHTCSSSFECRCSPYLPCCLHFMRWKTIRSRLTRTPGNERVNIENMKRYFIARSFGDYTHTHTFAPSPLLYPSSFRSSRWTLTKKKLIFVIFRISFQLLCITYNNAHCDNIIEKIL